MKKNNTLKVLLITILFTFLLTWILPITYFNSGLYTDVRYPAGLFDIFNYPTLTFYYFGQMAIYVLAVGAFYGVFNKTGVDVSKDEYFKDVNLKINEATTLEELKEVEISYIQGYFEYNNIRLDKTSVDLALDGEQGVITYDDRVMRFDPDAEVVFGDLIETIGDIKYETGDLTDEELKKKLVKQILLSELYEVVTINEQQLTLRPVKCPNDEFTI